MRHKAKFTNNSRSASSTQSVQMSSWQAHLLQGGYASTNGTEDAVHRGELSLPSSPGSEDVAFAGFVTVVKPYKRSSCRDVFAIVDGDTYVCSMLLKEQPVRVGDELCAAPKGAEHRRQAGLQPVESRGCRLRETSANVRSYQVDAHGRSHVGAGTLPWRRGHGHAAG